MSVKTDLFWQRLQVVLESLEDGRQYVFELNDRLIRDNELDGLTEIPVKPGPGTQQLNPVCVESDGKADELEMFEPSALQGQFCLPFVLWCRHF